MDEKIDTAIETVLGMIRTNMKPEDVIRVSQAALNLAQTRQLLVKK